MAVEAVKDVTFTSSWLQKNGKSGMLKPDGDGYYEVVLGGLNVPNSAGAFYALRESEACFRSSSIFMTNVREGVVYAEYGHPDRTPEYDTDAKWAQRFCGLDMQNTVGHIAKVWLDPNLARTFNDHRMPRNAVVILGKVKPYGPRKDMLIDAISNPKMNLCFSIRCITDTYKNKVTGALTKVIKSIITFDQVYSGGILFSKKEFHPSTEAVDMSAEVIRHIVQDTPEGHTFETECKLDYDNILVEVNKEENVNLIQPWEML